VALYIPLVALLSSDGLFRPRMLWPFCAPPARKDCPASEDRRTDEPVPPIVRCTCNRFGSEIRPQRKKDWRIKREDSETKVRLGDKGDGGMLQSAATTEEEQ